MGADATKKLVHTTQALSPATAPCTLSLLSGTTLVLTVHVLKGNGPPAASSLSKKRTYIQNNQNLADLDFFSISKLDANACNSPGYIIPVRRNSLLKLSEYAEFPARTPKFLPALVAQTGTGGAVCKGATPSVEQRKQMGPWPRFDPRLAQVSVTGLSCTNERV